MTFLQTFLILLVAFILLLWYLKFLWNRRKLYFHSWSVPGPFAIPLIGTSYICFGNPDDILDKVNDCMTKYPSPVKLWLGPRLLYGLKDPYHIEKVLTDKKCLDKGNLYRFISFAIGNGLLTAPVSLWRKHRKTIMPSFNQKILDSFVDIFAQQVGILVEVLEEYVGNNNKDISQPISAFTLDTIMCILEIINLRTFRIWHHLEWTWKLYPISKTYEKHLIEFRKTTSTVVKQKLKDFQYKKEHATRSSATEIEQVIGSKKKMAFLDILLQNSNFTEQELRDEVEIFLIAGTDTTATATCFLLEMCGMFPDIQQKVYEEILDVVGKDRLVEAADLPRLQYLEKVIKETLRLFPVGAHFLRTIGEDIDLGTYILPKDATAYVSVLNVQRNPKYWPEPLKFDPDRFLPDEVAKRHPCSYIPFSFGLRNCIGAKYAMMNVKTVTAATIRKYRVFTSYKSVEEIRLTANVTLKSKNGYKFYLEHR